MSQKLPPKKSIKKSPKSSLFELIREIRAKDPRYPFVFEALDYTLTGMEEQPRHVNGHELLEGIREYAVEEFGLMARSVFECWGIHETSDFGRMVFNLIDAGLLGKAEADKLDDFKDVYDFAVAFETLPRKELLRRIAKA